MFKHQHTYDEYGLCFECDKPEGTMHPADEQEFKKLQTEKYLLKGRIAEVEAERDQIKADYDKLREAALEFARNHVFETFTI